MSEPCARPYPGAESPLRGLDRFFSAKIAAHGASPAGVDWNSRPAQQVRFTQLLRLLDYPHHADEVSIIDYGCGYGALAQRLVESDRRFTYTGFDMCEAMIDAARSTVRDPRCKFVSRESELCPADFTVACGVFSMKLDADEDWWKAHVAATIARMSGLSRLGFAFNLLTGYADKALMRADLFYCDPSEYFDLCKRLYSRNVALLHDYDEFEFTLLVRLGTDPKPLVPGSAPR